MGIRDLKQLIKRFAPQAITKRHLSHYKGKRMAIDISIYLYRFKAKQTHDTEFIGYFVKQILKLRKYGIEPVYVFDGKPPKAKEGTLGKRTKRKNEMKNEIQSLEQSLVNVMSEFAENKDQIEAIKDKIAKTKRNMIIVKNSDKVLCIKLFDLMGIPYLIANGEAEILCSRLSRSSLIYGCFSEDTDLLPNGCNYFITDLSGNEFVTEYDLNKVLTSMGLTYDEFVDLCILCGCDYVDRINGIGPINAYKLIKEYKSIENILTTVEVPNGYVEDYTTAKHLFTSYDPYEYSKLHDKIGLGKHNPEELLKFIKNETDMCDKFINDLFRIYSKQSSQQTSQQTQITDYFK